MTYDMNLKVFNLLTQAKRLYQLMSVLVLPFEIKLTIVDMDTWSWNIELAQHDNGVFPQ